LFQFFVSTTNLSNIKIYLPLEKYFSFLGKSIDSCRQMRHLIKAAARKSENNFTLNLYAGAKIGA